MSKLVAAWNVLTGKASVVPSEFTRDDMIVGRFSITTSDRYTRINIQGREFFFTPTGEFDGAGVGLCDYGTTPV